MAHQPNLLPLKAVVICLGIILIGGTIFLFATLAHKAGQSMAAIHCPNAEARLDTKGKILNVTPQNENVLVTMETAADARVITLDACSGKTLRTLTIVP